MGIRVWASPPVQVAVPSPGWNSKAAQYCTGGWANFFPSNADGSPASSWIITIGRSNDWTAASADAELVDLFGGDIPSNINTPSELRSLLRSRTIGDLSVARRNAIQANLDNLGVVRSDFTLATTMWKLFQRTASTLFEKDANFGSAFEF